MDINVSGNKVHINKNIVDESPYLKSLYCTSSRDVDLTLQQVISYINFIKNCSIADGLYDACVYMGHELPKDHGYKKDYYNAILMDWWEENIGNKALKEYISSHNTEDTSILSELFGPNADVCFGGGYALYLAGKTKYYSDKDVFLYGNNSKQTVEYALDYCKKHNISYNIHEYVINIRYKDDLIQVITKQYATPWDILDDFDLDSCCILATRVDNNLEYYTNNRGKYAINNKLNHFNPDRYQIAYPSRMVKYYSRGFKIHLPDLIPVDVYELNNLIRSMSKNYIFPISWLDSKSDTRIISSMLPEDLCMDITNYIAENYCPITQMIIYYSYNLTLRDYTNVSYREKYYSSDKEFFSMPNWSNDSFGDKIQLRNPNDLYDMAKY